MSRPAPQVRLIGARVGVKSAAGAPRGSLLSPLSAAAAEEAGRSPGAWGAMRPPAGAGLLLLLAVGLPQSLGEPGPRTLGAEAAAQG